MAGGGTGGHVIPALAVARELRNRGHSVRFIGTQRGMEARLVPAQNFPIDWIEIGGLKRVGLRKTLATMDELPLSVRQASRVLETATPAMVFSMGGYVAGPVLLAAVLKRVPIVVMEPNAVPGFTHRLIARFVRRCGSNRASADSPIRFSTEPGDPFREVPFGFPPQVRRCTRRNAYSRNGTRRRHRTTRWSP